MTLDQLLTKLGPGYSVEYWHWGSAWKPAIFSINTQYSTTPGAYSIATVEIVEGKITSLSFTEGCTYANIQKLRNIAEENSIVVRN